MDSSSPPPSSSPAPSQAPARSRGATNASQRWSILRRSLLARSSSSLAPEGTSSDQHIKDGTNNISRKASRGFNLIECHSLPISQLVKSLGNSINGSENDLGCQKDVYVYYKLPCGGSSKLNLVYRREDSLELNDMEASNRYNIDTTGLVVGHQKRSLPTTVLTTQTCSDIQKNISINAETFGETKVKSMILHWDKEQASEILNTFDIIVASDCTFFKQFHESLARTVKSLLKHSATSQAIFLSPQRGDSLDKFLRIIKENGLNYELIENYDPTVWDLHKKYVAGDDRAWPNYDKEHCYPLLVRISSFCE
ncbi:hypothetical protein SEVIR_9G475600v4 [Setaria viridis]